MRLRILVVDDHAPFRRVICTALQRRGRFVIAEAADGAEAVRKAGELQPEVILLDINLPILHGFDAAPLIRARAPRSRLLFVSQEASPDIVGQAFSLGADGFVHKQHAGTDLLPAIDAVLPGQRFVSRSVASGDVAVASAPHRHEMLFCPDDEAIVDGFTRFVAGALNGGDGAIVLATAPHRRRVLQGLRRHGVDPDPAIARGTCLSFDADDAFEAARFLEAINAVREAARRAGKVHPRVAFCGERAGRLWAAGRTEEAVQLEVLCNRLPSDVDILCIYPVPRSQDDEALQRICAGHTAVSECSRSEREHDRDG